MHHSGYFYGFCYKGCSQKNKLCLSEPFSPSRFVIALITNVGGYRSSTEKPDLQLQMAGLNHCDNGTAPDADSGERSASAFTESWRDVSMSCACSGVIHCTCLSASSQHQVTHRTMEDSAHCFQGLFREQAPAIHRLKSMSNYHFTLFN